MTNIDFKKIRALNGKKQDGFEELVCQLAKLEKPENGRDFWKKNGSGGDAGVECYWILDDETEHCWQAKFFIDEFGEGQWQQITKSVKQALDKHPKTTRYYIALPLDFTDVRANGKDGTPNVYQKDKWASNVAIWEKIAEEKGMRVEFICWGSFTLRDKLTVDSPKINGMRMYWFDDPVISFDSLRKIAENSRHTLGPRFTPEFNVELPIASVFECFGQTQKWYEEIESVREDLSNKIKKNADAFVNTPLPPQSLRG